MKALIILLAIVVIAAALNTISMVVGTLFLASVLITSLVMFMRKRGLIK